MSEQINDGGPAFPSGEHWWNTETNKHEPVGDRGMSLRDHFAGEALCGWAAGRNGDGFCETSAHDVVAEACYKYADAMLKARKR